MIRGITSGGGETYSGGDDDVVDGGTVNLADALEEAEEEDDNDSDLAEQSDGYGGSLNNDSDLAEQSDGYGGSFSTSNDDDEDDDDDGGGSSGGFLDSVRSGASDVADAATDRVDDATDAASDTVDNATDDPIGLEEWRSSDEGEELQREAANADGPLDLFNTSVKAGTDFVLDNPNASVQDSSRSAIAAATGAEDGEAVAEAAQDIDEGVTESIDNAVEGTAFDNAGTDAVRSAGNLLIGETIRTGVGAATGINTKTGGTEDNTGALDVAEIGLTLGTAGVGKAATTALRGGDDLFKLGARGADDAAGAAARSGDEALDTAGEASGLTSRISDSITDVRNRFTPGGSDTPFSVFRGGDDAARTATGTVDEAADAAAKSADETPFSAFRATDEAAETASRTVDDVTGAVSRAATGAARAASNNRLATAAVAGSGALIAGGAAHEELFGGSDEVELTDKNGEAFTIFRTEEFAPTDKRPNGGVLWRVEQNGSVQGFTVVLNVRGEEVVLLGGDGGTMTSTQTTTTELQRANQRAQEASNGRAGGQGA